MRFEETTISGVFLVIPEAREDERGLFARTFCGDEFAGQDLMPTFRQCSISFNKTAGTLRGMHFQTAPKEETKLVRCVRGSIFDVIIDLRPHSKTYLRHLNVRLDEENRLSVYVPIGCAHGFLSLADNSELLYMMDCEYSLQHASGVRWNDPLFAIDWPMAPSVISARDAAFPDYVP